jgi:tRNA-guanine family transglycosylase
MVEDMINKRELMDSLMIDSAGIVAMGLGDTDWFNRQPELVEFANAVEANVITMLDVLTKPHLLELCKLTVNEAQNITIRNARQFLDLKSKARKCYVLQGNTDEDYEVCIKAYQDMGIFDDNQAIIGVGSRAGERRETTIARYGYCCKRLKEINPKLGIHAFGIGTPYTLVELYKLGVSQCDNATPQVLTQINQWIDARTGEPAKNVRLCDNRISAMFNSQLLWNYAAYFMGLSQAFSQSYASVDQLPVENSP